MQHVTMFDLLHDTKNVEYKGAATEMAKSSFSTHIVAGEVDDSKETISVRFAKYF